MNNRPTSSARLERLLANILQYGTWLASTVIAVGLVSAFIDEALGMKVMTTGIALFILLPILRVVLMLVVFVQERDYRFGLIATIVLMIISLSFILGLQVNATLN